MKSESIEDLSHQRTLSRAIYPIDPIDLDLDCCSSSNGMDLFDGTCAVMPTVLLSAETAEMMPTVPLCAESISEKGERQTSDVEVLFWFHS